MRTGTIFRTILRGIEMESPTILTVVGVTGLVTTVILAVRATPKALYLLELERDKRDPKGNRDISLSKIEIIKTSWKCYVPAALIGGGTVLCFIGAHSINLRRNAALAGLFTVSEAALREYQEKVIEVIGENKERKIHDSIVQDHLDKNPLSTNEVLLTGKGEVLFYDSWSGRYFKSEMEKVRKSQNDLNHDLLGGDMYLSLNSFYDEVGLDRIKGGEEVGWTFDAGMLDIHFTSKIADMGVPCIVIEYRIKPVWFKGG
jgi:hypothetical protein